MWSLHANIARTLISSLRQQLFVPVVFVHMFLMFLFMWLELDKSG